MGEKLDYKTRAQNYKKLALRVLLDNTQDVSNLGAALRICDALCVEYLYCSGDEPKQINKKIRRVARGADSHVPYHYEADLVTCIQKLKTEGFTVIAVEITSSSKILQSIDFEQFEKIALVVGAENLGISEAVIEACDFAVHIPMYGKGFSMNVTSALAIALYEVVRQKNKQ
jgi:tRNA G18 (ribose-2'-O)-methylase SpoU